MYIKSLSLQNFRSYQKTSFDFSINTTLVVGPNTAGKSNLVESIFFLAKGGSFRIDKDEQMISFGKDIARIKGDVDGQKLEVVIAQKGVAGKLRGFKKYIVNGVAKRKTDFLGNFLAVLFAPNDLDILIGSPLRRRDFMDNVLSQIDHDYRNALSFYEKGLRSRNALLHKAKETGRRNDREFVYWDNLLIIQGQKITRKREELMQYIQNSEKSILDFDISYDKSAISEERLLQYKEAEAGAGVTLVGPHRDDFAILINANSHVDEPEYEDIRYFGSRGQQRLAVLQLKLLELNLIQERTSNQPVLLLDDIFSELDDGHINLLLEKILLASQNQDRQVIITTAHRELIPKKIFNKVTIIDLQDSLKK